MAEIPREVFIEINRALTSIKNSMDVGNLRPRVPPELVDNLRQAYLAWENIRFTYRAMSSRPGMDQQEALDRLRHDVIEAIGDENFMIAEGLVYRPYPQPRDTPYNPSLHPGLSGTLPSVMIAMKYFAESLDRLPYVETLFSATESAKTTDRLRKIVPASQAHAPLQFEIVDHKLTIFRQDQTYDKDDESNIQSARSEILSRGEEILKHLSKSNCDQRLIDNVKYLQERISSDRDIVRLGLASIACEVMSDRFTNELPDAVSAMLKSHTISINMYVAQFSQWQIFSEKAAFANMDSSSVPAISSAVDSVITALKNNPDYADPEVPRTLLALKALIEDPRGTSKKAIYAVWRSLENLFIKIFRYGADFIDKCATKLIDGTSTAISKAVVVGLMSAALAGAVQLSPVAVHIPESSWIAKAVEVVRAQIEQVKN